MKISVDAAVAKMSMETMPVLPCYQLLQAVSVVVDPPGEALLAQ
jgi:hypothetical protein